MRTKVTTRGQVSIPSAIRRQLGITPNTALEWKIEGNAVRIIPIPPAPTAARGSAAPYVDCSTTGEGIAAEMPEPNRLVLDTSAILAMRSDEAGADRVESLLRSARAGRATVLLSFMTRMELLYRIGADEGQ